MSPDDTHRRRTTVRGQGMLDAEAARRWTTGYVVEGVRRLPGGFRSERSVGRARFM